MPRTHVIRRSHHQRNQLICNSIPALQSKLSDEKITRQKAEQNSQEKERQISMLSVDYRQIQQRLQKLEGEYRQVTFLLKL